LKIPARQFNSQFMLAYKFDLLGSLILSCIEATYNL
jgi:hypothetical protein